MNSASVKAIQLARANRWSVVLPREFARKLLTNGIGVEYYKFANEVIAAGYTWAIRNDPPMICVFQKGYDPADAEWLMIDSLK